MRTIRMDGVSMDLDDRQAEAFGNLAWERRGELERMVYAAGLKDDPASLDWAKTTAVRFATWRTLVNAGMIFEETVDPTLLEAIL